MADQDGIIEWETEIAKLKVEAAAIAAALPECTRLDAWIWLNDRLHTWERDPRMTATTLAIWNDFYRKYLVEVLS